MAETFEEFRKSFSYGTRNDLSFKFLKSLSDDEAADLFQELLWLLGEAYDTGDVGPLVDAAYRAQIAAYAPSGAANWTYDDRPFTSLAKPLAESRVGLLTSSGHHVDDPQPFGVENMSQEEAEARIGEFLRSQPVLTEIARDAPADQIEVRHGGYDTRSTQHDLNVTFPRDRLLEAKASGRIADVAPVLYSFTGATSQGRLRKVLPAWIERLQTQAIDVLLLVPV